MSKRYSLLIIAAYCLLACGCASTTKQNSSAEQFRIASAMFNEKFPKKWPPKPLDNPLDQSETRALTDMTAAVANLMEQSNVKFHKVGEFEIEISPEGESQLNRLSSDLRNDGIIVKYDALYFARNPFSAGTFDERSKSFLFSQSAMSDEISLRNLINHEMVHVGVYRSKMKFEPSPFYCKFTGKQFEPHYLACDEMKAYNLDLKNLFSNNVNTEKLKAKIQAAKMHTQPIPVLIENLEIKSAKTVNGVIRIQGTNQEGNFQMEFPEFVLGKISGKNKAPIKKHLNELKRIAIEYLEYISGIEQTI